MSVPRCRLSPKLVFRLLSRTFLVSCVCAIFLFLAMTPPPAVCLSKAAELEGVQEPGHGGVRRPGT